MAGFIERAKAAINIITKGIEPTDPEYRIVSSQSPTGRVYRTAAEAVLAPIISRISVDCANIPMKHVIVNEDGLFQSVKPGELNDRLRISANIDQTGTAFVQELVENILTDGVGSAVPVEVSFDPSDTSGYDILQLRTGFIEQWNNKTVRLLVYDQNTGNRRSILVSKTYAAIVYNPLYRIMNEPNSTLKRLQDKLSLLDTADNRINSPGLDLILQLPYAVKNTKRAEEAAHRRELLEQQLYDSRYGVAYVDATEKVTQLNRPVSNTLPEQIQYLTDSLYSQLGLTPAVFSGTAEEAEVLAYYNRSVLPILNAITESMRRAFLSQTAISQGQDIMVFPNIFKMAPVDKLAEAADKFTRNEIMTSNEFRGVIGLRPKDDPEADVLRNKNLNKSDNEKPTGDQDKKTNGDEDK